MATSSISAYGTSTPITDFTKSFDVTSRTISYVTDANGNKTSYIYDNFNHPIKSCFPLATTGSTSSTTDCVQTNYSGTRIATATMRYGQVVNYAYDAIGRVSALSGALTQTFAYNNFNMVTSHTNNGHYANYSYNSLGWLLSVANDNAGALTISYGYDAYGRRTRLTALLENYSDGMFTIISVWQGVSGKPPYT